MVSGAPRSTLTEVDNTQMWTEESGLGVYIGLPAKAGRLEPYYVPDLATLKSEYTVTGSLADEDDVAFQVAKRIVNTTGLGLYVNRVVPEGVLYGGCTIPCGTTRTASSLALGLSNPNDIIFNNTNDSVSEQATIQFKADVNGNTAGTAINLPGHEYIISFKLNATTERDKYTAISDVNGLLNGRFFVLPNEQGYVWFNVDSQGTDPKNSVGSLKDLEGFEVGISKNQSSDQIVNQIISVLNGRDIHTDKFSDLHVFVDGNEVYIRTILNGNLSDINNTYFTLNDGIISIEIPNSSPLVFSAPYNTPENLNNKYGEIPDYYIWFNYNETGTDPELPNLTGIEIKISESDDFNTVCNNLRSALTDLGLSYEVLQYSKSGIWFNYNSEGVQPTEDDTYWFEIDVNDETSYSQLSESINNTLSLLGYANKRTEVIAQNDFYVYSNIEGMVVPGNSGCSGFAFERAQIGYDGIGAYETSEEVVKVVEITKDESAEDIATDVYELLTEDPDLAYNEGTDTGLFTSTLDGNLVTITCAKPGATSNISLVDESPAPVIVKTIKQGSEQSGSDVLFLYFNNPSIKANYYGVKLYNCEDYPEVAPEEGTFVIEVYTKSNTKTPESVVTCSRNPLAVDSYNNSMYVVDVLERLTNIRAIDNTDVAPTELPRSITSILWFNGGNSGGDVKLADYITAVQPMVDREQYSISLLLPAGYYATAYIQELDRIAAKRGEAVCITGLPTNYETSINYLSAIKDWINNEVMLTDSYAAVFSPAAKAVNGDTGKTITLPIETCVAEQIAYANENYSISQPILGFARGTIQGITGLVRKYSFSDDGTADGDILYDNRINPIRHFRNQGFVIWGQKTTQNVSSARDRLNVRLMLIALKPLINNIQLGLIGELMTQSTKKRAEGLLKSVFDTGVGRNWFYDDYQIEIVNDSTLEAQHIYRINYIIRPYYSIEYVQGQIVLTNGVVSEIS